MHTTLASGAVNGIESHNCFYRAVVDQMLDLVTITDLGGTILYISPSVERLLGRPSVDRVGRSAFDFVHPDDLELVRRAFEDAVRSGEPAGPIEYRCRHRDGDYRVLESIGGRCIDDSGVMLMLIQSRDVTERSLRATASGALTDVTGLPGSNVRDFNNLLVVLARQMGVLESARSATVYGDSLSMRAAIDRARFLVNQLLSLASLDESRAVQSTDINRTLEEMAPDLERVSGPGIEVIYLLGATMPHVALARTSLERVLLAFMAYVRDNMPGGGRLTLSTRNAVAARTSDAAAGGRVPEHVIIELAAASTVAGGLQRRELESAFTAQGSEPGVHTAYTIVRKAGGRIAVDANEPGGTTLRVQLPVAQG
jgi:PAS domain S-box-containing protein